MLLISCQMWRTCLTLSFKGLGSTQTRRDSQNCTKCTQYSPLKIIAKARQWFFFLPSLLQCCQPFHNPVKCMKWLTKGRGEFSWAYFIVQPRYRQVCVSNLSTTKIIFDSECLYIIWRKKVRVILKWMQFLTIFLCSLAEHYRPPNPQTNK